MAKDRKPASGNGRPAGKGATASRGASGGKGGKGGRTRPVANVVAPQRPWGLIAAAVAVVVFAVAVIGYAVLQVNKASENDVSAADEIDGVQTLEYADGQEHVTTEVDYTESPPVGGPHDGDWADCTGTVYDVDIRHENAVHGLEHGAVWITYNPDLVADGDVATLTELVEGENGRMLSPYSGLDTPISLQSWNHQLKVDSADDIRVEQFADFFTFNSTESPEPGATCEKPAFAASPLVEEAGSSTPTEPGEVPTTPAPLAEPTPTEPAATEPTETTAP